MVIDIDSLVPCPWTAARYTIDSQGKILLIDQLGGPFVFNMSCRVRINGVEMRSEDASRLGFRPFAEKAFWSFDEAVNTPGRYSCFQDICNKMEHFQMIVEPVTLDVQFRIGSIVDEKPKIKFRQGLIYTRLYD